MAQSIKRSRISEEPTVDSECIKVNAILSNLLRRTNCSFDNVNIVSIGSQGAGKSSLLNNISGFDIFPCRDENDSHQEPKTKMIINVATTNSNSFSYNEKIYERKLEMVRDVRRDLEEKNKSAETVRFDLTLSGPSLYNLNFHDIPGISAIENNEEKNKLIELLREELNSNRQNIYILVIPCGDVVASNIISYFSEEFIRLVNEQRLLIVITKPDSDSMAAQITHIMRNGIRHHNFIVPAEKIWCINNISKDDEWFNNNFKHLTYDERQRCGIKNLRNWMSNTIKDYIKREAPRIKEFLENHKKALKLELSRFQGSNLLTDEGKMFTYNNYKEKWLRNFDNFIKTEAKDLRDAINKINDWIKNKNIYKNEDLMKNKGGLTIPVNELTEKMITDILKPFLFEIEEDVIKELKDFQNKFNNAIKYISVYEFPTLSKNFTNAFSEKVIKLFDITYTENCIKDMIRRKYIICYTLPKASNEEIIDKLVSRIKETIKYELRQCILHHYIFMNQETLNERLNDIELILSISEEEGVVQHRRKVEERLEIINSCLSELEKI